MLNLDKAQKELKEKSYLEIQEQTAWTWASRACASYIICMEEDSLRRKVAIYQVAEEYNHEALEHAALFEDDGKLLNEVQKAVDIYRDKAAKELANALDKI